MTRFCRYTRGYVLLPVAVAIALIAVIAFLASRESAIEVDMAVNEFDAAQAEYVAQAGLQHAEWLAQNSGCSGDLTLASSPLGLDSYSATVTTAAGSSTAYNLVADQDAWLKESSPTENHGSDSELSVKAAGGDDMRALYHYDLSTIPPGAEVASASAWFYVSGEDDEGAVDIHEVTAAWTEATVTWATSAGQFDSQVIASIPIQSSNDVWVQVNLTTLVQSWVNGNPNNGIMLIANSNDVESKYSSREWSPSAERPRLEVVVNSGTASPATIQAIGTLVNGVTRTITRANVTINQPHSSIVWQPGAELEDAFIWDGAHTNKNFGTSPILNIKNDRNVLIRFALEALPPDARVIDASLGLYLEAGVGVVNGVLDLHAINRAWVEGIYDDVNPATGDGVTYQEYDGGNLWATPGGDYDAAIIDSITLPTMTPGWYEWNVTNQIRAWLNGAPNYGLLLREGGGDAGDIDFVSSDNTTTPELHPRLNITIACECGLACVIPQGSGKIVLIGNYIASAPDPRDLEKEAIIESWGYEVDIYDDNAIPSIIFNNYDLVYVSETGSSVVMGTQLSGLSIGVVNEQGGLIDELEIAAGDAYAVGSSINIVDNSHYITVPFALGFLPIFSADMELLTVSGAEAPGLQTLADVSGAGSLVLLDIGAQMTGGGNAPGRRVNLPLGRATNSNFDWDHLNSNGRLIVQRAIEWGTGNTSGPVVINVLFVVPDATALGPQDTVKRALMESWNFGVVLITAADTQANFDAAVASADVVYISEEINSPDIGTKLRAATIGVVIEETALTDEFGISSSHTGYSGTDIEVVEITHYITSVFAMGPLTIASSATDLDRLIGILAPGLNTLAQITAIPGLATLDTGDQLYDTGTAAGRRVKLPWGTSAFDINLLTADGLTVMKRALEWGAGASLNVGPFNVLFVVGNVGGPGMTAEEIDYQTLLESWGHTVEIIDDGASQVEFDTAVGNNDVAFTTNDITASNLGTKLVNATIGVVTSEDNLSDEFGLSSTIDWDSGTVIEINDNTHYITSPFATGFLTILTSSESLAYVTGTLSPALGKLASSTSGYGIVTLEAGATLFGGGSAAGRRAQLPWGGNGADPNNLTADGLTILKRALEWGAGEGGGGAIDPLMLSTDSDAILGGLSFTDKDLAEYNPATGNASLFFDGGLTTLDEDITAVHVLANGHIVLSPINNTTLGGQTFEAGDLVDYDPIADSATLIFDGSALFTDPNEKINAVHVLDNGHLVLATDSNAMLGSLSFTDRDLAEYDPATDTATLFFDGSLTTLNNDITALHILPNGHLVLAAKGNPDTTLGGITFEAGDLVEYDPVWDTATLIFDGDALFTDPLEKINSVHVGVGSGVGAPASSGYVELQQPWSASTQNTWETINLSSFGVPANAVVEVAVTNSKSNAENWGGVRAMGSSLERRFLLHESESGGVDAVTLHVQADSSGQIQHYTNKKNDVSFTLLGYWFGATYVELFETFGANASNSWISEDVSDDGLGPNQIAEIVMVNTSTGNERLAGVRTPGSSLQRRFDLHEAESNGIDAVTMMVNTDAGSTVEAYAESNSDIDFYVIGYWSTPPGTYTENGGISGQVSASSTWEPTDLTGFGVPADTIAQFVIANENNASENNMGVRATGSSVSRLIDLHKAESGGADTASMHVNVDGSSQVEWYTETGGADRLFYPVGWWVLSP